MRFRLVAKGENKCKGDAFRLKKAKTSKNAVFATGAEGGSRSADCPSKWAAPLSRRGGPRHKLHFSFALLFAKAHLTFVCSFFPKMASIFGSLLRTNQKVATNRQHSAIFVCDTRVKGRHCLPVKERQSLSVKKNLRFLSEELWKDFNNHIFEKLLFFCFLKL